MKAVSTFLGLCALILSSSLFSQPLNDNCANAIALTVGSECISEDYTSIDATAEDIAVAENPSCGFYQGSDVWFSFVVPTSGNFRVDLSGNNYSLYEGSCGNFTEILCEGKAVNFARPDLSGQTLFIRAFRFNNASGSNFSVCVWEINPPSNDNCANATSLVLGTECVLQDYSTTEATSEDESVAPNPTCGFYQGTDSWFSFEVPASGNFRVDASGTQYAIYTGSCGNFTEIKCDAGPNNYIETALAGQTIYLRAYRFNNSQGSDFSLCVWEFTPQPNDNCADAIELPVQTECNYESFSHTLSTAEDISVAEDPSCGFYQGGDTWYTFTVPASGQFRIDATTSNWVLYQGGCGSFTEVICENGALNFNDPSLAGEVLYLRTFRFNSDQGSTYDFCITETNAPVNDNCANALELSYSDTCLAEAFSSQFSTAEDVSVAENPACGFFQGGDIWFQFQAPPMGNFTIDRPTGSQQFAFYTGSCGDFTEILCEGDDEITFNDPSLGGETIYIRAYRFNSRQGSDFELCLLTNEVAASDNCGDAISLSVDPSECNYSFFDSYNATDEEGIASDPTCGQYQGDDVWFTFEVPANGKFAIQRQNVVGNFRYSLYTGTCGSFGQQICTGTPGSTIYDNPALAGQTLYMRVWNRNSTIGGIFGLCVVEVDCNNTIGGTAFIDNCDDCVGGTTGIEECVPDCNGDFGGTAVVDNCGFCIGGNTGESPCVEDCAGVFGGTSIIDDCGECVQGSFFNVFSRESEVELIPTNLGYSPGFTGINEVPTVVNQSGTTSLDDILISGPLFYGPDGFGRVNIGSYFALQNLDVSQERIDVDLIQRTTATGEAAPGSWITSSFSMLFTVSTDQEVLLDISHDGATNIGLDAVSATLQRFSVESGDTTLTGNLFSLFVSGTDGGGTLSSPQSLQAGNVYKLTLGGRSFSGPIVVAVNSFVRASLRFSEIESPEFNESCTDCAGVLFGTAFLDSCGTCVGGDTGQEACCPIPFPALNEASLTTQVNATNVGIGWESVLGQVGCQVQLRFAGAGSLLGSTIVGGDADSFTIPGSVLQLNQDYEWRVRCGCSQTPVIAGPFSSWQFFSTAVGANITASPNPVADNTTVTVTSDISDNATVAVFDLNGRQVAQLYSGEIQAEQSYRLTFDASGLPNGVYLCRYTGQSKTTITKIMVAR